MLPVGRVILPTWHKIRGIPEEPEGACMGRVDQKRPVACLFRREPEGTITLFQVVDPVLDHPPEERTHEGVIGRVRDRKLEGTPEKDPPPGGIFVAGVVTKSFLA